MRRIVLVALVAATALGAPVGRWAWSAPASSTLEERRDRAKEAHAAGEFESALAQFGALYDETGDASYLLGVILCQLELERWRDAWRTLDEAFAAETVSERERGLVEGYRSRLYSIVGRGTLVIADFPPGASVEIDRRAVGTTPLAPLRLPAIPFHVRVVSPDGAELARREVSIAAGKEIRFAPAGRAGPFPGRHTPWEWILLGVGGAAIVTGGVLWAVAEHNADQLDASFGGACVPCAALASERSAHSAAWNQDVGRLQTAAGVIWGLGGALLVAGGVLVALELTDEASPGPGTAELRISPLLAPSAQGFRLELSF